VVADCAVARPHWRDVSCLLPPASVFLSWLFLCAGCGVAAQWSDFLLVEEFLQGAMMSVVSVPTRSLPPCGFSLALLTGFFPRRYLAIRAAKRTSRNTTPARRPSIPSILKTLNAGQASVVQVIAFLFLTNST
jgi:hypothetical protein